MSDDPLQVLQQRERYLRERIKAKQEVGWEVTYDQREQEALAWAIEQLLAWSGGRPT